MNYENLNDEQMIGRIRDGEDGWMDRLLEKYKPLVRGRANAMYLIGGDTDDLIQEGMIGLFKAVRDYDAARGTEFSAFARLCVTRQLYNAVEAQNRRKNAPLNEYVSLDASVGDGSQTLGDTLASDGADNPEQRVIDRESASLFWRGLRERLSPMEREVFDEYLQGFNYRQIAEHMGKSPKAVDNALSRIKGKMHKNQYQFL